MTDRSWRADAAGGDDLAGRLDALVDEHRVALVEMRHHLHAHPELSNREVNTAAFIADHLRALGLDEVRTGIAGHGVVGVLRGGQPGDRVVALRADIDALPVKEQAEVPFASSVIDADYPGGPFPVAHACGHDCHTATVLAAATVLASVRDDLPGAVMFVFQPAEEGPPVDETGGAAAMCDLGAFEDPRPTMVFGMHVAPFPKGTVGYMVGNQFAASCLVKVAVTGVQVHASTPWLGVDPLPAASQIVTGSAQLYRSVSAFNPFTISFGHVEDVGRFNIIGGAVTLWGTIRCTVESDMAAAQGRLCTMAEAIAQAHGCEAEVEFLQPVPAVNNTQAWLDATLPTIERVVGAERVFVTPPGLGYDDVSYLINAYGGVYLQYGVQDTELVDGIALAPVAGGRGVAMNHNPAFYADDDSLTDSLRIHVHVALDHLAGIINPTR